MSLPKSQYCKCVNKLICIKIYNTAIETIVASECYNFALLSFVRQYSRITLNNTMIKSRIRNPAIPAMP